MFYILFLQQVCVCAAVVMRINGVCIPCVAKLDYRMINLAYCLYNDDSFLIPCNDR